MLRCAGGGLFVGCSVLRHVMSSPKTVQSLIDCRKPNPALQNWIGGRKSRFGWKSRGPCQLTGFVGCTLYTTTARPRNRIDKPNTNQTKPNQTKLNTLRVRAQRVRHRSCLALPCLATTRDNGSVSRKAIGAFHEASLDATRIYSHARDTFDTLG